MCPHGLRTVADAATRLDTMLAHGSSLLAPALLGARTIVSSCASASAAPALALAKPGLLSSIFGLGGSRIDVPLSEKLPAVTEPPRTSTPATRPAVQTSSLSSGVKVATIESVSPLSSLVLFVEGGSSAETSSTAGASKLLEVAAFKATANRSTFRLTRELEKIGATSYCRAGRDHIAFGVDAVRLNQREALEMLADAVVNARYPYWEVRDSLDALKEQLALQLKNPLTTVNEVLHRAAFDGGLGNSLVVDPSLVDGFSNETLKEYLASIMTPSRIVLAGVGVDHAEILQLAGPLLSVPASAPAAVPASKYVGGAMNVIAPSSALTYVALGFEAVGGASTPKSAAAAAVTKALLDEARPTLPRARKEHAVFRSLTPFAHLYKGSGLVGLTGSSSPAQAGALVDALTAKVQSAAKGISEAQLAQAKALALGELKAATATTAGLVAAVGSSVLATGKFSGLEVAAAIQAMTAAEASSYVAALIKTPPTVVSYGNLSSLPRSIAGRFA
ncbi:Mitochondrial-processing peptidase subunit alpha [Tetrabaena socialis]|uniref:Mitochondrial-processing peptidase subunit alpha n=1 Tax=Tetrabaena socialis TaxID=47790 RepID=A0A2J8A637_9CHLO|nr:Mitochondrial-processing peptidase subunit alpha [Tetrabaena socialis]|eukprot:PNH07965.1 Mitochondrial-processing peptidase subunit alpha [Tetrabaena socialis]